MKIEISKEDVIETIKDELIDDLREDFFEWVNENSNDAIQEKLFDRISNHIIEKVNNDTEFYNEVKRHIFETIISNFDYSEIEQLASVQLSKRIVKDFVKEHRNGRK